MDKNAFAKVETKITPGLSQYNKITSLPLRLMQVKTRFFIKQIT